MTDNVLFGVKLVCSLLYGIRIRLSIGSKFCPSLVTWILELRCEFEKLICFIPFQCNRIKYGASCTGSATRLKSSRCTWCGVKMLAGFAQRPCNLYCLVRYSNVTGGLLSKKSCILPTSPSSLRRLPHPPESCLQLRNAQLSVSFPVAHLLRTRDLLSPSICRPTLF